MKYKMTAEAFTDKGLLRKENQDSFFTCVGKEIAVFCVADGMGGHADGKKASSLIAAGIREWSDAFYPEKYENGFLDVLDDLECYLQKLNRHIFRTYNNGQICGSTLAALLVYEDCYAIFWIGDSRVYRKRRWAFEQLTKDDSGQNSNGKLTKAFGVQDTVVLHRMTDRIKYGDAFFLCSDGVYRYCGEDVIRQCCKRSMKSRSDAARLKNIQEQVELAGAPDNLTAVLVRIER